MRVTIDLPDELHQHALAIARHKRRTLSETVVELVRRGMSAASASTTATDPRTGLPLVRVGRIVTADDVRSLDEDRDCLWPARADCRCGGTNEPAATRTWRRWNDVTELFAGPADPAWDADRDEIE